MSRRDKRKCPFCGREFDDVMDAQNDVGLQGCYGSDYDGLLIHTESVCNRCFGRMMAVLLEHFPEIRRPAIDYMYAGEPYFEEVK